MSQRGLYAAFRTHVQHTIGDELLRVRLREAEILMLETNLKFHAIAEACGFGDARNFHNAFRKRWQMAPRDWRRERKPSGGGRVGKKIGSPRCVDSSW